MGKSVLTPEENLLGKVVQQGLARGLGVIDNGGKGIRPTFRNLLVGN